MRVLWFSVTPSLYGASNVAHNGGGWIESLERLLRASTGIKLGVAFEHADRQFKVVQEGVAYYPIPVNRTRMEKVLTRIDLPREERNLIPWCLRVIADFKPDVIHVFGSEWCFGLVAKHTCIPVVIHMQGSLPAYYNARLPPGFGRLDLIGRLLGRPGDLLRFFYNDRLFKLRAGREKRVLAACPNFMGRTQWDQSVVQIYRPDARYFHCDEVLRPVFYAASATWTDPGARKMQIISVISAPLYKGMDVILRAADLLKHQLLLDFQWDVFGVGECGLQEAVTGLRARDLGVKLVGVRSAGEVSEALRRSTVYVHPSYIDNSPNSLCEAQMVGVPVVAANVGGVGSMVRHGDTGLLFPANEIHMLASSLRTLSNDRNLRIRLSEQAHRAAAKRHAQGSVLSQLLSIYRALIDVPRDGSEKGIADAENVLAAKNEVSVERGNGLQEISRGALPG